MTHGMLGHLGPLLACGRLMKISPFTFQTEFSLAPDHSAGALPHSPAERTRTTRKDLHPARASPLAIIAGTHGDMSRTREHRAREQGRKEKEKENGGRAGVRCSDAGGDAGQRLVTRRQSSPWSHGRGGRRSVEPQFQRSHANKGKIKERG
ncbi:hypothetical protein Q8A73_008542 [Channa argus]|nr:hypothetical protein Q8A73_008542 [Channa argus]